MARRHANSRILFVTIGQSPRPDLLEHLKFQLPDNVSISETGLLDGLSGTEISSLIPEPDHRVLLATLSNGSEIQLSHKKIERLASDRFSLISAREFDLVVLLSTGYFRDLESNCPTVNTQRAMEAAIISLASSGDRIGLIYPLERQIYENDNLALSLFDIRYSYADHGCEKDLKRASAELSDCDYLVLNSVGYGEPDRQLVSLLTNKPVILPLRIIASSVHLILNSSKSYDSQIVPEGIKKRIEALTTRERQVMSLVCEGLSNKAIGRQLDISYKTVEIHRSNVLKKMETSSSIDLIRMMIRNGLV